jgi:molybdopterin synthase sulfur carrier subunit
MNLKIRYFGLLAEITNHSEETIVFSKSSVSDLLELLFEKYPKLKEKDFQVAQDLEIVSMETILLESEIALLPPFSGG